jgi:putative SbcD/Mre11-related phosphoesterase
MRVLADWLLTAERVAVHLPSATGVVADLHLGYGQARRRRGDAVPETPSEVRLAPLGSALARHGVRRLVVAGDLFEDGRCRREESVGELRAWLEKSGVELAAVVPGNHDRGLRESTGLLVCREGYRLGKWQVVHGDAEVPDGPLVQGHEHPWLRWPGHAGASCYLVGDDRLVLPAYSTDAAGVNVLGARRWDGYRCCGIVGTEVMDFGPVGRLRLSRHAFR